MFRSGDGLRRSLALLDDLWAQVTDHASGGAGRKGAVGNGAGGREAGREALRARETVALVAAGRWVLNSAIVRQESRGMHHRVDAPDQDPRFRATVSTWGLDTVLTKVEPVSERQVVETVAP